jgi:peptidase E
MQLHLFSTPGERAIEYIVEAGRLLLEGKSDSRIAYLPLASLSAPRWMELVETSFKGLARIDMIDAEKMTLDEMEIVLRRASAAYIPGGNTFLLNHRLHVSKLMPYLRKKIQAGLPLLAFSAGTILCGPNILTSKDMNTVETTYFDGLKLTPFNFLVHYGRDGYGGAMHDEWLSDYHVFHDNPVVLLEDGAYLKIQGSRNLLVRGQAWILRKGQEKKPIEAGQLVGI